MACPGDYLALCQVAAFRIRLLTPWVVCACVFSFCSKGMGQMPQREQPAAVQIVEWKIIISRQLIMNLWLTMCLFCHQQLRKKNHFQSLFFSPLIICFWFYPKQHFQSSLCLHDNGWNWHINSRLKKTVLWKHIPAPVLFTRTHTSWCTAGLSIHSSSTITV